MEIARDFIYLHGTITLLAKVGGRLVKFEYPDRATGNRAFRKMLREGAEYLSTAEESRRSRWADAPVVR